MELAGVEPASEISTYHFNAGEINNLCFKSVGWFYLVFVGFMLFESSAAILPPLD
ncbi:hypothetical protein [Enterobacter ludwigii]|uniref:hypothetical protein n=1 Tax=Enterobacter ludwigii TaxID=299767 RepID=UPI001556BEAA|nr:hypothetical protein [Enterobacter ludwigii]